MKKENGQKKLWGGRFEQGMHPALQEFSCSLAVDSVLFHAEIQVNRAWVKMLAKSKIVSPSELKKLLRGLDKIEREWDPSQIFREYSDVEDIHALIQILLEKACGAVAKKLHTGRSRNDLVVTSTRIYLKEQVLRIRGFLCGLQKVLVGQAEKNADLIIPGLTHLRKAQPVLLAHHLLAYVEMLEEDLDRLKDFLKRVDVLPLGSAALSGSALPFDRKFLAKELGFSRLAANSMAATSDRAFLSELLSGLAAVWIHLSRLSEDFILWNSEFFGYVELDDRFSTGSSLMPQKKNPDVFELIRGKSGSIFGILQALLVVQKGLPLAYNRDLQEDKPGVFYALSETELALEVLSLTVQTATFQKGAAEKQLMDDGLYATDLLEYLVRQGMPFKDAHHAVGRMIAHSIKTRKRVRDFSLVELNIFAPQAREDAFRLFSARQSVEGKKTFGSTQPGMVKKQIQIWKKKLK
jgi:argininosuccinate lyase